jgi:hypothetical protein
VATVSITTAAATAAAATAAAAAATAHFVVPAAPVRDTDAECSHLRPLASFQCADHPGQLLRCDGAAVANGNKVGVACEADGECATDVVALNNCGEFDVYLKMAVPAPGADQCGQLRTLGTWECPTEPSPPPRPLPPRSATRRRTVSSTPSPPTAAAGCFDE